jgi:hypothetical protein
MSDRYTIEEVEKLVRLMREARVKDNPSAAVSELLESGADVIERLQREVNSTLGLLYLESERHVEAETQVQELTRQIEELRQKLLLAQTERDDYKYERLK